MSWTALDTGIVVVAAVSAMACALIGSFLVLRRMSMMGDAISHAVLPGIAVAFLVTLSRDPAVIVVGAALAGVLTAAFTQLIHQVPTGRYRITHSPAQLIRMSRVRSP